MEPVRAALELVLRGHEPYPAAVVDRTWELIQGNRGIALLIEGVDPELLAPPVNVLRVSLHPSGMAPNIVNLAVWRAHLLERLERQIAATGDPQLASLRVPRPDDPGHQPRAAAHRRRGHLARPVARGARPSAAALLDRAGRLPRPAAARVAGGPRRRLRAAAAADAAR